MTFHRLPELVDRAARILRQNNSASAIARGCGEIPKPSTLAGLTGFRKRHLDTA